MKFTIYQDSHIGKRKSNQDRIAYCYSRNAVMLVVADGMGGHLHGEVAAQICVQYLIHAFQKEAKPVLRDPFVFLSRSINNAHHAILEYAEKNKLADVPRTTCVACVVQDNVACWAHAGDSRLYHLRGGYILAQTKDHSRLQILVDQGQVREDEIATHPLRNRIFSCLGGPVAPQIEYAKKTPLHANDILVLCTDGLWANVAPIDLIRFLAVPELERGVGRLMQHAEQNGGRHCDNLSMIALRWEDNYQGEGQGSVSTQTMRMDAFTNFGRFTLGAGNAPQGDLSDDEIEKAIQEINHAIQKFSK